MLNERCSFLCIIGKNLYNVCNRTLASLHTGSNRHNRVDSNTFYNHCFDSYISHQVSSHNLCYNIIIHLITLCLLSAFSCVFSHSTHVTNQHTVPTVCTYVILYVLQRQDWQISSHWIVHLPASYSALSSTLRLGA